MTMKIKVKVKKGDYTPAFPAIIVMVLFFAVSFLVFSIFAEELNGEYTLDSFMEAFSKRGMVVLFAVVFFLFACYLLYYLVFKNAKPYKAVLISKTAEYYKGKNITYMTFKVANEGKMRQMINVHYSCYVDGICGFKEGEEYLIYIKEFNWKIKSIGEPDISKKAKERMRNTSLLPVILGMIFVFGGCAVFLIVKIFYDIVKGRAFAINFFPLVIMVIFILAAVRTYKLWSKDNSLTSSRVHTGRGLDKGIESLPSGMINSASFSVTRKTGMQETETFMVIDSAGTQVLTVKNSFLMPSIYNIEETDGCDIGVVKNSFDMQRRLVVSLNGEASFSVRRRVQAGTGYEIDGLDFSIEGDYTGTGNVLLDLDGNEIATINAQENEAGLYNMGSFDISVNPDYQNNIYIILVAVCVVIINWHVRDIE
ncbi:MAG: hypothetical protein ACI4EF_13600 [Coprococcus sp.]